jgi:hypothetical protein
MEVKPAEFARLAGVSRASICGKMKKKTLIVNSAGFLDTENPVNARYISNHNQKAAETAAAAYTGGNGVQVSPVKLPAPGTVLPAANQADDYVIAQLSFTPREALRLTIRELILKFPGLDKIERYAKILKDFTMAAEKDQRMKERGLTLIEKDFVVSRLFGFIDTLTKQSLEFPEAVADRVIALSKAQGEAARSEVIAIIRDGIGRVIAGAKGQVIAELNVLKSKYQTDYRDDDKFDEIKEAIEEARNEQANARAV